MWSRDLIHHALYASTLLSGSRAAVPSKRQEEPETEPFVGAPVDVETDGEVPLISCSDVDVRELRDPEEAKRIWDDSGAGKLADDYINEHGVEYWVQNLDQDVFDRDGGVSYSWDCREWGSRCELQQECTKYEESDYGAGAFFLFYSLQQYHTFMTSFHDRITEKALTEILDIFRIQDDFEDKDAGEMNAAVIIAGSLGILAGFGAAYPLIAGSLGVIAGTAVIGGNVDDGATDDSNGAGPMSDRVKAVFQGLNDYIDTADGGVFGIPGYDPEAIPEEMQKQEFDNPSVRALGDGQWLTADPTAGLAESMDAMYDRIRQGLAWSMMRHGRHAFVFIDKPVTESECGYNYNMAAWDPDLGVCFRLFYVDAQAVYPVENDLADKLWDGPYSIDRLEAYRNAYQCWIDHDGGTADPDYTAGLEEGAVPPCFFSMVVVQGTYKKSRSSIIFGEDEFPGQVPNFRWHPEY